MLQFPTLYHHGTLEHTPYIEDSGLALDPAIRTPLESGLVQTRARFSRVPRRWRLRWDMLSAANKGVIRAFELARLGGTEAFAWVDPDYSLTNLLTNPGFETGDLTGWSVWGSPDTRAIVDVAHGYVPYEGLCCLQHFESSGANDGSEQSISCYPGLTYSLSVWCYRNNVGANSIKMVSYNGSTYTAAYPVSNASWEQLTQSITTGQSQTSLSMWIGGLGSCFWDLASISTSMIRVRFASPASYIPEEGTARTRWRVILEFEEV